MIKFIFLFLCLSSSILAQDGAEQVLSGTIANIRGQVEIYKYGWKFVSSSEKAFKYSWDEGVINSSQAITQAFKNLKRRGGHFPVELKDDLRKSLKDGGKLFESSRKIRQKAFSHAKKNSLENYKSAINYGKYSWASFSTGYITLSKRTEKERRELSSIPGGFFSGIKSDYSNFKKLMKPFQIKTSKKIEGNWEKGFQRALKEFDDSYQKSGGQSNSLMALPYVIWGGMKSLYYAVFRPSKNEIVSLTKRSAKISSEFLTLPIVGALIVSKRAVQAVGVTLYQGSKGIYKIISPSLEGGFFAAMGMAKMAMVPTSYLVESGYGVLAEVSGTALTPVATAGSAASRTLLTSGKYMLHLGHELGAASAKVAINTSRTGIVLGYNAITAIPTQLLLGTANVAYFLVWDGPRLALYSLQSKDAGKMPVGTTMDMEKMKENNFSLKEIKMNDEELEKVLKETPKDFYVP